MKLPPLFASGFVAAAILLAGCSDSDHGSSGGASASGESFVLLTDAAADDFSAFEIQVTSMQAIDAGGSLGPNQLAAPVALNLLDHEGTFRLLGGFSLPAGSLGVKLAIDSQIKALNDQGSPVLITAATTTMSEYFTSPLANSAIFGVEIPVDDSTLISTGAASYNYTPSIHLIESQNSFEVNDLLGEVVSENEPDSSIQLQVRDSEGMHEFGFVKVKIDNATRLTDQHGNVFGTTAEFFLALELGDLVEVEGSMVGDATIHATLIMIQDPIVIAKIRGFVTDIDTANNHFDLQITRIVKGAAIVEPVLASLPNSSTIQISYDGSTPFFLTGPGGGLVGSAGLSIGQYVTVRFTAFAPPEPFPASAVIIHGSACTFKGQIVDDTGLPATMQVLLKPWHPLVLKGILTQQVTVDLSDPNLNVYLGVPWVFPLTPTDLLSGQQVKIKADLSASANTIDAHKIRIYAGLLFGTVLSEDPSGNSFSASYSLVLVPFGGSPLNPATIRLHDPSILLGKLGGLLDNGEFFDKLEINDHVWVRGIGKANGDIDAYFVKISIF